MSSAPPGWISSAGWKISRTRPGSDGAVASARPAPSSIAVCASCPQACMTFGTVDANGRPVASCSGRASMSARSATQRLPRPTSQTSPVPPGRVRGSRPAAVSRCATNAVVPRSARPSSGVACRARRQPRPRSGAAPARRPASPDRCPRRGRRPRGRPSARRRTPTPTGSSDSTALRHLLSCIHPYSSPGRRCTKPKRPVAGFLARGVVDLLRAGGSRMANGRTARRAGSSAVRRTRTGVRSSHPCPRAAVLPRPGAAHPTERAIRTVAGYVVSFAALVNIGVRGPAGSQGVRFSTMAQCIRGTTSSA